MRYFTTASSCSAGHGSKGTAGITEFTDFDSDDGLKPRCLKATVIEAPGSWRQIASRNLVAPGWHGA
jgi:hypothetical protein